MKQRRLPDTKMACAACLSGVMRMKQIVVYVHGKGGSAEEAEHYSALFPDSGVLGFDYRAQTPWEAREEFPQFFAAQRARCGRLTLIANSIGAYFSSSARAAFTFPAL